MPSRPSGAGTSVRAHGKAVPPEVSCQPAHILVAQSFHMHEADFMLRQGWLQMDVRYHAILGIDLVFESCCRGQCHDAAH